MPILKLYEKSNRLLYFFRVVEERYNNLLIEAQARRKIITTTK